MPLIVLVANASIDSEALTSPAAWRPAAPAVADDGRRSIFVELSRSSEAQVTP